MKEHSPFHICCSNFCFYGPLMFSYYVLVDDSGRRVEAVALFKSEDI